MKQRWDLQIDYWQRLPVKDQEWLRNFEAQYRGKAKSDGTAESKAAYARDNAKRRDALNVVGTVSADHTPLVSNFPSPETLCMAKEIYDRQKRSA